MAKLSVIEGIGGSYEQKLNEAGINSIEKLLEQCSSKKRQDQARRKVGNNREADIEVG